VTAAAVLAMAAGLGAALPVAPKHGPCHLCGNEPAIECGAGAKCLRVLRGCPPHRMHRRARQINSRRKYGR